VENTAYSSPLGASHRSFTFNPLDCPQEVNLIVPTLENDKNGYSASEMQATYLKPAGKRQNFNLGFI